MNKKVSNRSINMLLIIAFIQGPVVYYYTTGFIKLIALAVLGLTGFLLTLLLFLDLNKDYSAFTRYQIFGLTFAFIFGTSTLFFKVPMEYLDWTFRKWERNKIVEDVKKSTLQPDGSHKTGTCHLSTFLPLSNNGNDIGIDENTDGIVSVKFYIDQGFLDHYSAFLYTNDPDEIHTLDSGIGPFGGGVVKKLDTNWYRVAY